MESPAKTCDRRWSTSLADIVMVETTKHRVFQFLDALILPDNMLIAIASDDAANLGIPSSRIHVALVLARRAGLGVGNDPALLDPPLLRPLSSSLLPRAYRSKPSALLLKKSDAHRKRVLAEHPKSDA